MRHSCKLRSSERSNQQAFNTHTFIGLFRLRKENRYELKSAWMEAIQIDKLKRRVPPYGKTESYIPGIDVLVMRSKHLFPSFRNCEKPPT